MSDQLARRTGARATLTIPDVFGLRVFRKLGLAGVLKVAVAACFVAVVIAMITMIQPDLANQTAIGTDSSNYYAAGLRLNDGHSLYHLSPGDRPVPPLPPPHSDAALLSPPLLGVLWRPIAVLGDVSMILWWLAGVAALGAAALWMIGHGSARRNVAILLISPFIALAMWSGNVNPFIVTLLIGVWAAASRGRSGLAGGLLAVAAGLKLTPFYLLWWFVVRRDWPAVRAFVAVGLVLAVISLVGAGTANHVEYLDVIRATASTGVTPWSVAGFLHNAGVPMEVASAATFAWLSAGLVGVWLLRHRTRASYSIGILTVLYSSPVVLLGNLAVLLAATAPFPAESRRPANTE